jgi:AraC-like DNA-binding protein
LWPQGETAVAGSFHDMTLSILTARSQVLDHWQFGSLRAPYWRLYHNTVPGWRVRLDGKTTPLRPDRLLVIPPDTPFAADGRTRTEHLYLHFAVRTPSLQARPAVFAQPLDGPADELIDELRAAEIADETHAPRHAMLAQSLCFLALSRLPADAFAHFTIDPRVQRAVEYMESHLDTPPDNESLAALIGMNYHAFIRLFRRHLGEAPQRWLTGRRVERACNLLHHTTLSIEQIAERLGFCDRYHFSRLFKQHRGLGPAAFRRQMYTGTQRSDDDSK